LFVSQREVYRLKKLATAAPPGDEGAADQGEAGADADTPVPAPNEDSAGGGNGVPSVNTVLPDAATLEPLRKVLYDALVSTLPPLPTNVLPVPATLRDIAYDGLLWNFPFPETVNIEMIVPV
jgi:hypothetical protein